MVVMEKETMNIRHLLTLSMVVISSVLTVLSHIQEAKKEVDTLTISWMKLENLRRPIIKKSLY